MKEIINWLIEIESSAADLYAEVADAFRDDEDFSRFLALMSAEEREHANLLQQSRAAVPDKDLKSACFYFDDHFRKKVEAPFVRARSLLANDELTKSIMVDILAEAEFSEWNEVFLYTLDTLKVVDEDVQKAVADIDQHRKHVQEFILSLPGGDSLIQRARRLSRTGGKRVLIVEDNHAVARMLEALAGEDVEVIIAHDGLEGIVQIREGHFDLIVANIEMPEMNGIEMFKQAGFELVASSEINANPKDQPGADEIVWRLPPSLSTSRENPELRAAMEAIVESDRMTLLFRKAP